MMSSVYLAESFSVYAHKKAGKSSVDFKKFRKIV